MTGLEAGWREICAAVIPCLNEERTIGSLVEGVRRHVGTVFVVDDGSADSTGVVAAQAGAEVLRNDQSQGKGAALQTGWRRAIESGFEWSLTLDGDGQHSTEDIPSFFTCVERTSALLVVGNRMGGAARMPPLRRFVNRWLSRRLSLAARQVLPDSQCGFRLINLEAWSALRTRTTHFEVESEVLLAFARAGHCLEFVPVQAIYKGEQSKIHPMLDTFRWFRWWWRR